MKKTFDGFILNTEVAFMEYLGVGNSGKAWGPSRGSPTGTASLEITQMTDRYPFLVRNSVACPNTQQKRVGTLFLIPLSWPQVASLDFMNSPVPLLKGLQDSRTSWPSCSQLSDLDSSTYIFYRETSLAVSLLWFPSLQYGGGRFYLALPSIWLHSFAFLLFSSSCQPSALFG